MAKLLYGLKLCLFQDQFHLSKHECTACSEFSLFVTLVSVKAWMSRTSSCDAPDNDLSLIQHLANYRTTLQAVADRQRIHIQIERVHFTCFLKFINLGIGLSGHNGTCLRVALSLRTAEASRIELVSISIAS